MDFFTLQDNARKQTRYLAFLFALAIIAIVATTNLLFFAIWFSQVPESVNFSDWLSSPYWIWVSAATVALILGTSLIRSWQLKSTPDAIAKMVNADLISLSTKQTQERQLVNVVEEMSIASGMPIPKIYIMRQEPAINAFVAGLVPSQVCLVVTQGLLDNLNRHQLQGVIAHEYSHIFHGDMRINVRIIGLLAGILVLGQLGNLIMRTGRWGSMKRSNKSPANAMGLVLLGLGLFGIGYVGLFFGRLIKAAISRQREFLADASAVQYTRDKDGIAEALHKIASHQNHALLASDKAEEMSHLCFAESITQSLSSWLATHPPIEDRIKAINPGFSMRVKYGGVSSTVAANATNADTTQAGPAQAGASFAPAENNVQPPTHRGSVIDNIGQISEQHITLAHQLIESIPAELVSLARADHQADDCYSLVIALLILHAENPAEMTTEFRCGDQFKIANNELSERVKELSLLNFQQQHCLLDLSLARIEAQSETNNQQFVAYLSRLVNSATISSTNHQLKQTQMMIYVSAVKRALPKKTSARAIGKFKFIANEISGFFKLLYHHSELPHNEQQQAFDRQMQLFGIASTPVKENPININQLSGTLNKIARLNPLLKKDFIRACVQVVENDQTITQQEYELLRLLGEYLDSPVALSLI